MSSLQKPSKPAQSIGGVSVGGFLVGWFKTAKHRFGLHHFGQGTLLGVYRWLVLSLIAYLLSPKGVFIYQYQRFT